MTANEIVHKFDLKPHPEGGFYKRTFVAEDNSYSSILFLMESENFSTFHRIASSEQWNWYYGDTIVIHEIDTDGNYIQTKLSNNKSNFQFQYTVNAGNWFAAECIGNNGFAFCGCTVVPAFSFEKFELGDRQHLCQQFNAHKNIIERLTR